MLKLWSADGRLLKTATLPASRKAGWRTAKLPKPIAVYEHKAYVLSEVTHRTGDTFAWRGNAGPLGSEDGLRYFYASRGPAKKMPTGATRLVPMLDVTFQRLNITPPVVKPSVTPSPVSTPTSTPSSSPSTPTYTPPASPTPIPMITATPKPSATTSPSVDAPVHRDASNTGARDALLKTYASGSTITRAGTTIENTLIRGQVTVRADNVTLRNVRIESDSYYGLLTYNKNTVMEDVTVVGTAGTTMAAVAAMDTATLHVRRVNVSNADDGVRLANDSSLTDSYIHGLVGGSDSHFDAVTADGYRRWVISGNTIINDHDQTSALTVGDPRSAPSEGLVKGNFIAGGGYMVYGGPGTGEGVRVVDNVFSVQVHPKGGYWGVAAYWVAEGNTWTGNRWADGPNKGALVNP